MKYIKNLLVHSGYLFSKVTGLRPPDKH